MSCCANTVCLKFFVSDCVESVDTGLVANATGTWKVFVEFNGVAKKIALDLTMGDTIIVPNIFNTNYKHNVTIIQPNGQLFNDTCYTFDMCLTIDATVEPGDNVITTSVNFIFKDIPDPSAGDGSVTNPFQLQTGNAVSIPMFGDQTVHLPLDYNSSREYIPYNQNTNTFDRTSVGGFINNDLMTISYEKNI